MGAALFSRVVPVRPGETLPTLLATFVSFSAGLIAVALWQRINLLNRTVLLFFTGFLGLAGGLYAWLGRMPAERMAQMTGLLGSGLIVAIIALFIAVAAWRRVNAYEAFVDGAPKNRVA